MPLVTSRNGQEVWYPDAVRHYGFDGQCGVPSEYGYGPCRLNAGHPGVHDSYANWEAHAVVKLDTSVGSLTVGFQSEHDSRSIVLHTRDEAESLCSYIMSKAAYLPANEPPADTPTNDDTANE